MLLYVWLEDGRPYSCVFDFSEGLLYVWFRLYTFMITTNSLVGFGVQGMLKCIEYGGVKISMQIKWLEISGSYKFYGYMLQLFHSINKAWKFFL
jgi:hypothetical protein